MVKNIIYALALFIITSSCNDYSAKAKENNSPIVISGNVQVTDSLPLEKITLYGYDMVYKKTILQDITLEENGDFKTTISLPYPSALTIYGNNTFQILAIPGDSIVFNYTDSKEDGVFKNSLKFEGKTAVTQQKLQDYINNNPLQTDDFYDPESALDYTDLQNQIDEQSKPLKKYYAELLKDTKTNKFLRDYITADQKFAVINLKMDYASFAAYYGKKVPKMDSPYYKELNNLPRLEEEDLVNTKTVNSILYNHHSFASREVEKKFPEATPQEINQIIVKNAVREGSYFSKQTVAMLVMEDLYNQSVKLYENNKADIEKYLNDDSFITIIKETYATTKDLINNPQIPDEAELLTFETTDASQFLDEIIKNANGKVIYIDNWATWCGPCKAEFKEASPALHEKFKDDVEFVYLCHASEEKAYLPSIAQYQIKGKHYFLTKEQETVIQQQIQLEGFPTYTIFDKKGNLVISDYIHRPSYGPTAAVLTKLINEEDIKDLSNTNSL